MLATLAVAVMVAPTSPVADAGATNVALVVVMSVSVPADPSAGCMDQVTPWLLGSKVTAAVTCRVWFTYSCVTSPAVSRATPLPTPTLPVTPRLVLLQAASNTKPMNSGQIAAGREACGLRKRTTVNDVSLTTRERPLGGCYGRIA